MTQKDEWICYLLTINEIGYTSKAEWAVERSGLSKETYLDFMINYTKYKQKFGFGCKDIRKGINLF